MLLALCLVASAEAFPITSIGLNSSALATLNSTSTSAATKAALSNALVARELRKWGEDVSNMVLIKPGDIDISGTFPYTTIDDSCSHTITASDTAFDWVRGVAPTDLRARAPLPTQPATLG